MAANFFTQPFCLFVRIVLHFDFKEKVRDAHRSSIPNFYTKGMACAICQIRRPRRYCPGVNGDICSICCGTEREVTVSCPLDCPYLEEARKHDRPIPIDSEQIPNREIRISEEFLAEHEELLGAAGQALLQVGVGTPGAVDFDMRDALTGLIRTYQTLGTGLYYESVPENAIAAQIYRYVHEAVTNFRAEEKQQHGMSRTRDADVLAILVFFQRLELDRNNGRRRGRAFLDFLRGIYPRVSPGVSGSGSSSLLTG